MNPYTFKTDRVEDCRSGIPQLISNIDVCGNLADFLSSTLGPYGMDKLLYGKEVILTNDGATILENLNLKHPVGKMIASMSKSQDQEIGDGTTSVVLITSYILRELKEYVEREYDIKTIKSILKKILEEFLEHLEKLKIEYTEDQVRRLAETALNSKTVRGEKKYLGEILVEALKTVEKLDILKIPGGSIRESVIVDGIAFEKSFTYAGYEQQPKKISDPVVCCLDMELEWKSECENSELRIGSVEEYQRMVDSEWCLIKEKLDDLVNRGVNVVLSSRSIGDYATQYFAKKGVFCAGRVKNLEIVAKGLGISVSNFTKTAPIVKCSLFEERQLGKERYNYITAENTCIKTFILRGPGEEALNESERALNDAICVTRTALKNKNIVSGGGSVEMELSILARKLAFEQQDESVFIYKAVSLAMEKLPKQLATNFGIDPISTINNLRKEHMRNPHIGVCYDGTEDMVGLGVVEPLEVKKNILKASFSMVETILSIDSTIISKM